MTALAFVVMAAVHAGLSPQTALGRGIPRLPVQTALEGEALRFGESWVQKDTDRLRDAMVEGGVRLHLPGEDYLLIGPRQAGAALAEFLQRYASGTVQVASVSPALGDSMKGYAELKWTTGSAGVTEPVIFTLFVAFALEADAWKVTEIRVLFG